MFFSSKKVNTISCNEAYNSRDTATLIDVREASEYSHGHAEGAQNVPLSSLSKAVIAKLPQGKKLYIICQSGGRSARAAEIIMKETASDVYSVEGGTSLWQKNGLPMC